MSFYGNMGAAAEGTVQGMQANDTRQANQFNLQQARDQAARQQAAQNAQRAADAAYRQTLQSIYGAQTAQPPAPQAPAPGQASVPMQQPGVGGPPPMQQQQPQAPAQPPIQPYRAMPTAPQGGGQPAPQATPQAAMGQPPDITQNVELPPKPPRPQIDMQTVMANAPKDPEAFDAYMAKIGPHLAAQDKTELLQAKQQMDLLRMQNQYLEAEQRIANASTPAERAAALKARLDLARGNQGPSGPISQETVDYYASQSLRGDNSWQVGLARGKVGQRLIAAVKDRIPQMAKEQDITPQEASAFKPQRDALSKALSDRSKFVASGTQFVNNFGKQADIVEKYLKPGIGGEAPVINKWLQAGRKAVAGDADVTALDTAIRGLAREHQRIVTGVTSNAQLHASAQETADQLLNIAQTPEQINSALKVMREEAKNALDSGNEEVDLLKTQLKTLGVKPASTADTTGAPPPKPKVGDIVTDDKGIRYRLKKDGNVNDMSNWERM